MKRRNLFIGIFLSLSTIFISCSKDEENITDIPQIKTEENLMARMESLLNNSEIPGFAVAIVKNDNIIYQNGFGYADIDANKAYSNETSQPIGSISKTFVAAAIVKAIEQGYFDMDTDVNDILPFQLNNPKLPEAKIQVKHLVTHTSGLLDNHEMYFQGYRILPGEDLSTSGALILQEIFDLDQREPYPLDEFLEAYYVQGGELYSLENFAATAPGAIWAYSNLATSLAALLVETASGMPFYDYVQTNILTPLDMQGTAYHQEEVSAEQLATLYWNKQTSLPAYGNDSYPDGSIYTNNNDLTLFLKDMMKGARGESTKLFSKESYQMLFTALLPEGYLPAGLAENQSVFWFLNGNSIRHDGSDPGTTCELQFDKSGEFGYLILSNMDASTDEKEAAYFSFSSKVVAALYEFAQNN